MIGKAEDPDGYSFDHERARQAIASQLRGVSEVRLEYASDRDHRRQIRICLRTFKGWGYVEMSEWILREDGRWGRTGRVTLSPYSVLASVIQALKQALGAEEIWVPKRRRPGGGDLDLIRIAIEADGRNRMVDVRTWAMENWLWRATKRGLVIPLHLLNEVIKGLEQFAGPIREVNSAYLKPRFVPPPENPPLFEALFGDTGNGRGEDWSGD